MRRLLVALVVWMPAGCALRPAGESEQRRQNAAAGRPYEEETRDLPDLGDRSGPEDYLRTAFLRNAELERRYWEWRAAIERIAQDSSWPNPAFSYRFMFTSENMKAWDRTTLGIMNDPMTNIPFPIKLAAAGRQALEEARAAGLRFQETKFLLQGKVLSAYYDLALLAESIRIQSETVFLLQQALGQAEVRVQAGAASLQDFLIAQTEVELAQNEFENLKNRVRPLQARMNALLNRPPDAPVPLPQALPPPRPLPISDEELVRVAAERSPGLAALARDVAARREALGLARQAYVPDFGLSFDVTGNVSRGVGVMVTLPLRLEAIRAGIEQARANLRAARAARAQYERDLAASFVLNLYVLRNGERQIALFDKSILPRARQTVEIARASYAAGGARFVEFLEAQRTYLDARLTFVQLKVEREKALAALETWSAVDVETLGGARIPLRTGMSPFPAARSNRPRQASPPGPMMK